MSAASDSDSKLRKAQMFFQYGNDAAHKNNFDYAIQMYSEACKLQPANLLFRQSLRGIQRRKFGNEPGKVGHLVGAKTQPIKLKARTAKARGHWEQVLETLEEAFTHNPWDVAASMDAAEAAEQLGCGDVAVWLLESVLQQGSDDLKFLRYMARIYENNQIWQRAISCWERVRKVNPYDEDAIRQMNSLSARETIARSGMGDSLAKREVERQIDLPPGAEELRATAVSPEERLLREIKEQPELVRPYLELAELYRSKHRLEDAVKVLDRACKAFPDDNVILTERADLQVRRLKQAIEVWTKHIQKHPDEDEPRQKLERLNIKLLDYEIAEFQRRIRLRPEDGKLRFELGMRLAQAGRHDDAIAEFQQARSTPELKAQALYRSGLSFEANGVHKLAERTYQEALKHAPADDYAMLNALHYQLGRVAEEQGNLVAAEEHYNEVAANDYSYQDVARRLRALNQRGG